MDENWLAEYLATLDSLDENELETLHKYFVRVEGRFAKNTLATRKVAISV